LRNPLFFFLSFSIRAVTVSSVYKIHIAVRELKAVISNYESVESFLGWGDWEKIGEKV